MTFWEFAMLIAKGRVQLDRPTAAWVNDFLSTDRVARADLTPAVAVSAGELARFQVDPADRVIVASAVAAGVALVTKDGKFKDWAKISKRLSTVW